MFATEEIWHNIRKDHTVGVIEDNKADELITVAEPLGVLAGITPVTNPTSTTLFKAIIAMKTRNPIIFSFHHKPWNAPVTPLESCGMPPSPPGHRKERSNGLTNQVGNLQPH